MGRRSRSRRWIAPAFFHGSWSRCQRIFMAIVAGAILNLEVFAPAAAQTAAGCEAGAYGLSTSLDDNTAALTRALQACRGRVLHVRAGTYRFLPGQFIRGIFMSRINASGNGNVIRSPKIPKPEM